MALYAPQDGLHGPQGAGFGKNTRLGVTVGHPRGFAVSRRLTANWRARAGGLLSYFRLIPA